MGKLTTGALTLTSGSIFHFDASGTSTMTWDQVSANGATLAGSTLQLTIAAELNFTEGAQYRLIDNTSLNGISGAFAGIVQGGTYNLSGYNFVASYTGGTGNDFVLTAVPEPSTWQPGHYRSCSSASHSDAACRRASGAPWHSTAFPPAKLPDPSFPSSSRFRVSAFRFPLFSVFLLPPRGFLPGILQMKLPGQARYNWSRVKFGKTISAVKTRLLPATLRNPNPHLLLSTSHFLPMPPKADPYNTPVHRRIDLILFAVVFAIVAILLSTTAHAQTGNNPTGSTLITYFNFNDSNLQSDAPGARLALDSASTSSKFTTSFITPAMRGTSPRAILFLPGAPRILPPFASKRQWWKVILVHDKHGWIHQSGVKLRNQKQWVYDCDNHLHRPQRNERGFYRFDQQYHQRRYRHHHVHFPNRLV